MNLGLLLGSFDPEFEKNFRDLPLEAKLVELKSLLQTLFLTLAVDSLTQNKEVAKARDPKSPEREIQTGLNMMVCQNQSSALLTLAQN